MLRVSCERRPNDSLMYGTTSKPSFIRGSLLSTLGALFVSVGIYSIARGSFRYGRFGQSVVVTPSSHPVFFWVCLLFMSALGCVALWRGIADIRLILRRRARQLHRTTNDQTPSLPDARPRSDRFRLGGRESNFLADRKKSPLIGRLHPPLPLRRRLPEHDSQIPQA